MEIFITQLLELLTLAKEVTPLLTDAALRAVQWSILPTMVVGIAGGLVFSVVTSLACLAIMDAPSPVPRSRREVKGVACTIVGTVTLTVLVVIVANAQRFLDPASYIVGKALGLQ